jgi:hypothetical protein
MPATSLSRFERMPLAAEQVDSSFVEALLENVGLAWRQQGRLIAGIGRKTCVNPPRTYCRDSTVSTEGNKTERHAARLAPATATRPPSDPGWRARPARSASPIWHGESSATIAPRRVRIGAGSLRMAAPVRRIVAPCRSRRAPPNPTARSIKTQYSKAISGLPHR